MELKKAKEISDRTLQVVHPLIKGVNQPTKFSSIILGTLRRDYLTLYTITYLSDAKDNNRIAFGDSCMDLARRVIEDLINIEYIKLQGKDKYSKQFIDFKAVEAYQDLQYLQASGREMDSEFIKQITKDYKQLPEKLKKRKRWSGEGIEGMIQLLLDKGVIKQDEFRTLSQTYIAGNYKNHFSPTDIFNFLHNELYQFSGKSDLVVSLIVVSVTVTKIAGELIDEAKVEGKIKQDVQKLWDDLTKAHLENNPQT